MISLSVRLNEQCVNNKIDPEKCHQTLLFQAKYLCRNKKLNYLRYFLWQVLAILIGHSKKRNLGKRAKN